MNDMDKLIQTLENVHQSVHRVYRFLNVTPPCQSMASFGPEPSGPEIVCVACGTAIEIQADNTLYCLKCLQREPEIGTESGYWHSSEPGSTAPSASDTAQPTKMEERAWRIWREQAAGLFEELDRLNVQRQRQAVKDMFRGMEGQ